MIEGAGYEDALKEVMSAESTADFHPTETADQRMQRVCTNGPLAKKYFALAHEFL